MGWKTCGISVLCWWVLAAGITQAESVSGRVVEDNGQGVANAVVFVHTLPEGVPPPASARGAEVAEMDQVHEQFSPEVLAVPVGTRVHFPNHDQVHHHVYSFSRAKKFEIPLYKGEAAEPVLFDKVGVVKLGCNIHDWMSGVIVVVPTPYYTMTDENGQFTLSDLPTGRYALASWHPASRAAVKKTIQWIQVGADSSPVTFRLSLKAQRKRQATRGGRNY